jgi:hypothetical protein
MSTRTDNDNGPADVLTELARRVDGGIEVLLVWHSGDGRLRVVVDDLRTGDAFEVIARDGKEGLDVFYHPFAYAAARGVAYRSKARPGDETAEREVPASSAS